MGRCTVIDKQLATDGPERKVVNDPPMRVRRSVWAAPYRLTTGTGNPVFGLENPILGRRRFWDFGVRHAHRSHCRRREKAFPRPLMSFSVPQTPPPEKAIFWPPAGGLLAGATRRVASGVRPRARGMNFMRAKGGLAGRAIPGGGHGITVIEDPGAEGDLRSRPRGSVFYDRESRDLVAETLPLKVRLKPTEVLPTVVSRPTALSSMGTAPARNTVMLSE